MQYKRIQTLALTLCLAFSISLPTHADETAVHTIAVVEYPFSNAPSEYGKGLNVDWVSDALTAAGVTHNIVYLPIKRAFKWFEKNRYIALIGTNRLFPEAVQPQLEFIELDHAYLRFFYHKSHTPYAYLYTLDDLAEHTLVSTFSPRNDLAQYARQLMQVENPETVLRMVRLGRASLGLMVDTTAAYIIQKQYPDEIREFGVISRPIRRERVGLVINKNFEYAAWLASRFRQGLAATKKSGQYHRTKYHYFGPAYDLLQGLESQALITQDFLINDLSTTDSSPAVTPP